MGDLLHYFTGAVGGGFFLWLGKFLFEKFPDIYKTWQDGRTKHHTEESAERIAELDHIHVWGDEMYKRWQVSEARCVRFRNHYSKIYYSLSEAKQGQFLSPQQVEDGVS